MGLPAPICAVERDHGRDENLTTRGIVPLQRLLIVGDGETDRDPISQRRRQKEGLFVNADDAPLRDQEPAGCNSLDRIPPATKIEDVDRSPAIAPDADWTHGLDLQGSKLEGGQRLRLLR